MYTVGSNNRNNKNDDRIRFPRETALYLYDEVFTGKQKESDDEEDLEQKIRNQLQKSFNDLPYWVQVQLDFLI